MSVAPLMAIQALVAFAAGLGLGLAYFGLLGRTLALYLDGRTAAGAALQAGRFLLAGTGLYAAVHFGAIPLLACALGMLVGRHFVLRRARQVP